NEKRLIIYFSSAGEGHLSAIVFRRGILDGNNNFHPDRVRNYIDMANIVQKASYDKGRFIQKMKEMDISQEYSSSIMEYLPDRFEHHQLTHVVDKVLANGISTDKRLALEEMTWLVDSYYDIEFSLDSDISERVIFPISPSESKGIEDARFVRFTEDDGSIKVYATYTAYDGHTILPKLLSTEDFNTFRDRKSTRLNSSHAKISYAVFCLNKKSIISCFSSDISIGNIS